MPLTHQVDTKVNASKQEAQEESEGHDTRGGTCSSTSHSTGTRRNLIWDGWRPVRSGCDRKQVCKDGPGHL